MIDIARARELPFWEELSVGARDEFMSAGQLLTFRDRQQVIARGDEVAGVYLVARGALRIYFVNEDGREGTLYWVDEGETCILALNCLFSRLAYPAYVESEGAVEVIFVPAATYRKLFAAEPQVQAFTFGALSQRLFELMETIEETASHSMEARIAAFLLRRSSDGALDLTQEQIAHHMATAREVVSRILRHFARAGWIETQHGQIRILDEGQLSRLVK